MIALLTRDLLFNSKVSGTGRALGISVITSATVEQCHELAQHADCRGVLLDLGTPVTPDQVLKGLPPARPLRTGAFGSHVDTAALSSATAAGFEFVWPRSQFSSQLPQILKQLDGISP